MEKWGESNCFTVPSFNGKEFRWMRLNDEQTVRAIFFNRNFWWKVWIVLNGTNISKHPLHITPVTDSQRNKLKKNENFVLHLNNIWLWRCKSFNFHSTHGVSNDLAVFICYRLNVINLSCFLPSRNFNFDCCQNQCSHKSWWTA